MSEITNAEFSDRCDILKVLKSQVSSLKKIGEFINIPVFGDGLCNFKKKVTVQW